MLTSGRSPRNRATFAHSRIAAVGLPDPWPGTLAEAARSRAEHVPFKCADPDGHRVEIYWEPPPAPTWPSAGHRVIDE